MDDKGVSNRLLPPKIQEQITKRLKYLSVLKKSVQAYKSNQKLNR
jgi:hypothetical protein